MTQPADIYRAKDPVRVDLTEPNRPRKTLRMPGNVPYLVDNLWAWARPDGYPDRRRSAYASPDKDLAVESAGGNGVIPFRVVFQGDYVLAQLTPNTGYAKYEEDLKYHRDARYHPDCRELKREIRRVMDGDMDTFSWANQPLERKDPAARLFLPCLTAEQVEDVIQSVDALRAARTRIYEAASRYWKDMKLITGSELDNDTGELVFEYPGEYKLVRVD